MAAAPKFPTYGCPEKGKSELFYKRWAFANYNQAKNAPARHVLFRQVADAFLPGWHEWHSWSEELIETYCSRTWVGVSGCSSSQKTRHTAGFAVIAWLCDPYNTSVIFCSTTTKAQKQKGWGEIQGIHRTLTEDGSEMGNMVASQMVWEWEKGDSKHAILVKAIGEGDINTAAADIQGHHTKNQIVVIDEAEAVPPAIWKACVNLYSYPQQAGGYFILIAVANARSRLSQFGRYIEPAAGWSSVSPANDGWEGKPQMDGQPTKVIIFNFHRSPNILEGRVVSKHLPNKQRVAMRMKYLQSKGMENDPEHYCYDLGFPAPEGLSKTIFTETLLEKFHAYDRHHFTGTDFLIIGVIDPAFTAEGDRPALRFGALGNISENRMGLEWMSPIVLSIDATSPEPPLYQLLHQCQKHCKTVEYRGQKYECLPNNFGIDVTGNAGLADVAQQEWSKEIIRIMFQGSASEEACSHEDNRPAKEVYENRRVEMYFQTQLGIMSEQVKGVDKDTAAELCSIEESTERSDGTMKARKTLMSKKLYRKKFQKSCDLSDCGVMLIEVARQRGFTIGATGLTAEDEEETVSKLDEINSLWERADYSPDNAEQEPLYAAN